MEDNEIKAEELAPVEYIVTLQVQLGNTSSIVDTSVLATNDAEAVTRAGQNISSFVRMHPLRVIRRES